MTKPKKTLLKRIRVTKNGKIMKKGTGIGHLKRKMDASRKTRKSQELAQVDFGHRKSFKKLLGSAGKNIKFK